METKDQPQGNKKMPENPKPNEEVQLHIETVTPETEKELKPNEDVAVEDSKNQTTNADSKDEPVGQESEPEDSNEDQGKGEEHPAVDEISKDGGTPDDTRDKIETIQP